MIKRDKKRLTAVFLTVLLIVSGSFLTAFGRATSSAYDKVYETENRTEEDEKKEIKAEETKIDETKTKETKAEERTETQQAIPEKNEIAEPQDGLSYKGLSEEAYQETHWKEFFRLYPMFANAEGTGLKEGYEAFFMPYYSMTMEHYAGELFGAWEIFDAEAATLDGSRSIFFYGREDGEEKDRWICLDGSDYITPYYAEWEYHTLSASVINNNTVRIHIRLRVMDNSGGDSGGVYYSLGPDATMNDYSGFLKYPWLWMGESESRNPKAGYGSVSYSTYNNVVTSSSSGRWLTFEGNWDLSGEALTKLKNMNTGNTLYWSAGFKISGSYSPSRGSVQCSNLATAILQASCGHTAKRYTAIGGNEAIHNVSCQSCGKALGTEAHSKNAETGACSACGFVFPVSGTIRFELNGRVETAAYRQNPMTEYVPKAFPGYHTPPKQQIPKKGGDLTFVYEPISYRLQLLDETKSLQYDDSLLLPAIERKGCRHVRFYVE